MPWEVLGICLVCFSWTGVGECWEHQETSGRTWPPKTSFLAVFHVAHSQQGRMRLQQTGLPDCVPLAARFCRPKQPELSNHLDQAGHDCGHWSLWECVALVLGLVHRTWRPEETSICPELPSAPISKSSTWFPRKNTNSTALRFYGNPPYTSAAPIAEMTTSSTWVSLWL